MRSLVEPMTPDPAWVKVPALNVVDPASMPMPISLEIHGRGSPVTVICRVAFALADELSVARTWKEFRPADPVGGVPESVPFEATSNQEGPLTF